MNFTLPYEYDLNRRNLDGVILEDESDKENGEGAKGPAMEDLLVIHNRAMNRWNTLFIIVCAFSVLIDPVFFYIYTVEEDYLCVTYGRIFMWRYIILRSSADVFFVIDIIIFFCGICKKHKDKLFGSCLGSLKPSNEKKRSTFKWTSFLKEIFRKQNLRRLYILPRILVSLPIPAVIMALAMKYYFLDPLNLIVIVTPFQYILRVILIYGSQRWTLITKTASGRWLKRFLDFLPFILASHLYGALWYRLAVQRQLNCWKKQCTKIGGVNSCTSDFRDYNCYYVGGGRYYSSRGLRMKINGTVATRLQEFCPTKELDPKVFDFGIYSYALQADVTATSSHLLQRLSISFWWALRNLSSFGSNLNTSMDTIEILFAVSISTCGMALFLVYLNARVQESNARSNQYRLKEKKQIMKPNIDIWLSKNNLSNLSINKKNQDLKTTIKKKTLKAVISENIDKLEENKDIDLQIIISVLRIKFKKNITRLLCLGSLKKVPKLASLNAKMMKVICEHLKPVIYTQDNYIIQQGKPLGMMLFITQGLTLSYKTNNVDNEETSRDSSTTEWLKKGDFYGEELLNWAFESPSYSALPFSTRTVMTQTKVEAFALRANDLKSIVCKFWWHFTKEVKQADLEAWENVAASSIQATWRNKLARARRSNHWEKFTANY